MGMYTSPVCIRRRYIGLRVTRLPLNHVSVYTFPAVLSTFDVQQKTTKQKEMGYM